MNKNNIVWVFIDSVRTYYSNDDRSRLRFMDKFSEHSISLESVLTSAPSTVMSISAMMTGFPAFLLGQNYNDFRHDHDNFPTLSSLLERNGWDCNAILMHPDIREKLTAVNMYPRRKWPKGFSHSKWWTNQEIYKFLSNVLENENSKTPNKPKFWFIDYNCRKDPTISDLVESTFNLFYERGYNHSNTIFVLCSDHGYPDPSRGLTPEILKQRKMTHDMFMTDDNVMIPFFISFPELPKNIKFKNLVSTQNIFPTILDYLQIPLPSNYIYEKSLIPFFKSDEAKDSTALARCDARFLGQTNRLACVRSNKYKLVRNYDEGKDEFFKIENNEEIYIENALLSSEDKSNFIRFKDYFELTDKIASNFTLRKHTAALKKLFPINTELNNIFLISESGTVNTFIFIKAILNFIKNNKNSSYITLEKALFQAVKSNREFVTFQENIKLYKGESNNKYDLKIILLNSDKASKINERLFRKIRAPKKFKFNANIQPNILKGKYMRALRKVWNSREFYLYEPLLIIKLIIKLIKGK